MINSIIDFALRFRGAVIAGTLALVAAGIWAFSTITFDAFPDLTPNQVLVMTSAPGLSTEEVEKLISYPMETAMLGLPRTQDVRSLSKAGVSVVTITFNDDVDLYFARTQVQQRMLDAAVDLPSGLQPMLGPAASAMGEAFQYLVESTTLSPIEIKNLQEYVIRPQLRTIPGVADINSWGGMVQQFQVQVDAAKLAGFGLSLHDLDVALASNNENFGVGYIEDRGERLRVRGLGRVSSANDIAGIVVSTRSGGTPIYVRDVANVVIGAMPREGAVTRDSIGEALSGTVVVLKGANSREVIARVKERLETIKSILPPGVTIRPFYSQADVVDRTTSTVFRNLLEGALLVTLILFLFLRNVRASLIVASVIPLSLLVAFILMRRFNVSANLMSLGALDFGLMVDASIVMVENFVRRLGEREGTPSSEVTSIIRTAAFEVGRPIVFGVCIIIAVYVPIFTLEGLEGRMFEPMAFAVCVAVIGSLLLALTYVPAMSAIFLRTVHEKPSRWFDALSARYRPLLAWALTHRRATIGAAAVVLALTLATVPYLGSEFMPTLDEGSLLIETRRLPSTALTEGTNVSKEVERTLLRFPEVASVVTNLGRPELATETMGLYQADAYVLFKPKSAWKAHSLGELIAQMDSALGQIPGVDVDFTAPMAMRLGEVMSGVRTELGIKIFGDSLPILQQKAGEVRAVVESVRGAADVSVRVSDGAMQLELDLDRAALARYGLNVADVREVVQAAVGGHTASEVTDGRRRFPIVVRLAETYRNTPEAIAQLLLTTPTGARITLSQVAAVRVVQGPEAIDHESGRRVVVVQSNVRGRDLGGFASEVRAAVAQRIALPQGYFITYGGQFENQERALARLGIVVPIVLAAIMGLLYASFGNWRQSAVVMLNVPFALVGGVAMLWLRGLNLSLSSAVGFIALFGVAVLNGVVLLTYINDLRRDGADLDDAIRDGAQARLRPVLMTALVAGVGFLPMALSSSPGSEVQRPLASVVIGGLLTSTLLTLLVLPAVYRSVEKRWHPE